MFLSLAFTRIVAFQYQEKKTIRASVTPCLLPMFMAPQPFSVCHWVIWRCLSDSSVLYCTALVPNLSNLLLWSSLRSWSAVRHANCTAVKTPVYMTFSFYRSFDASHRGTALRLGCHLYHPLEKKSKSTGMKAPPHRGLLQTRHSGFHTAAKRFLTVGTVFAMIHSKQFSRVLLMLHVLILFIFWLT